MKKGISILSALLVLALTSCDDGTIYPRTSSSPEGKVVKLSGTLSGWDEWNDTYQLVLAGFDDPNAEYASIAKSLPSMDDTDGSVSMVLSGIQDNVSEVRLCVLDRLNRHIVTFKSVDIKTATDTVRMEVSNLDIGMFNTIQKEIFSTTCANCHGGSGFAAAGLYLTEGRSREALVGVASKKVEGSQLVKPGEAISSLLHLALNTEISSTRRYAPMTDETSTAKLRLIDNWINSLTNE